ncbi:MAG: S41 family peptidase [Clostridia bacterium]
MSNKSKIITAVIATFGVTCLLFIAVFNAFGITVGSGGFDRLESVVRIVEKRYIGEFDREKAENAAINALLSTLDDPYSAYYDRENSVNFMNTVEGNYIGVGIEIAANTETGEIVVISAYSGGPAKKAGMKSGDVLFAIDGTEYNSETMDDAVTYMRGSELENPLEPELVITVKRGGETLDLKMKREEIDLYRIEQRELEGGLLYLRYTGFSSESAENLEEIIENLDDSTKGIILDLRENPGGDLDAAVDVCDLFLNDGMIMYTEDKDGNREEMYATEGACDLPLALLVDGGTASASEIVAGCMQARGRAVIIGEKTYGKGVSQMVCALGRDLSGGIVKVTGYKNYRPDGIWLNEAVTPDIDAENNAALDEYGNIVFDAQGDKPLAAAIEELNKR